MAVLPLAKLGGLLIRQLAKPIASQVRSQAIDHPKVRRLFISFAQLWHKAEMQIKIRFQGHIPKDIKPLSEEKALQAGADVFSELFVYSIAAGVLLAEYNRSSKKEKAKEQELRAHFDKLAAHIERIQLQLDQLQWEKEGLKQSVRSAIGTEQYDMLRTQRPPRPGSDEMITLPRLAEAPKASWWRGITSLFTGGAQEQEEARPAPPAAATPPGPGTTPAAAPASPAPAADKAQAAGLTTSDAPQQPTASQASGAAPQASAQPFAADSKSSEKPR